MRDNAGASERDRGAGGVIGEVGLRRTIEDDLPTFFAQQLDPVGQSMAAFIPREPSDREAFMAHWDERPLHAGVARDNIASIRVLQKCGFVIAGEGRAFSKARGEEVDELLLVLERDGRR